MEETDNWRRSVRVLANGCRRCLREEKKEASHARVMNGKERSARKKKIDELAMELVYKLNVGPTNRSLSHVL